jgi:extracellular matrix regulatory protein A
MGIIIMSIQFVDIGFSNYVEASKILTVNRPDSSPIKRVIQHAKETGHFLDLTQGKKTRSIITEESKSGIVVTASAVKTSTIIDRIRTSQQSKDIVEKISGDIIEVTNAE